MSKDELDLMVEESLKKLIKDGSIEFDPITKSYKLTEKGKRKTDDIIKEKMKKLN